MKKQLSEIEIKNKIVKYLNAKGIMISIDSDERIIWYYEPHYSKFTVKLSFEKKDWNDDQNNIVRYYTNNVSGLHRRKTSLKYSGYCLKIYKILMICKEELDRIAKSQKNIIDQKTKYCTELESYYKRFYKQINISTSKYPESELIDISINCYGDNSSVYYQILYKENKYYLMNRQEEYQESPTFIIE